MRCPTAAGLAPLVSVALLLAACTTEAPPAETVIYEADYPEFESVESLVAATELSIVGTVLDQRVEELYPEVGGSGDPTLDPQAGLGVDELSLLQPVIVTISRVEVTEVIRGDVTEGDIVEVSQLGGLFDGVDYREAATTVLEPGAEYVLLLSQHEDAPADLLNPEQALFLVEDDEGTLELVGSASEATVASIDELSEAFSEQEG